TGAVALFVILTLAGCAPAAGGGDTAPPADTPSPGVTETAPPDGGDSGDGSTPTCTRDDLDISYGEADSSAGHRHGVLSFTNTAPSPCTLEGYPIVFMGNSEVAAPAGQQATEDAVVDPVLITLDPGNVATSAVTITQAGIIDGCTVVSSDHLIVAPPLDHTFVWEDDAQSVAIGATDSCGEDSIGLISVAAFQPL
ncbi:MAG: DUF4232 domain-containing protein, partial [Pseudolysinimonas sp.]